MALTEPSFSLIESSELALLKQKAAALEALSSRQAKDIATLQQRAHDYCQWLRNAWQREDEYADAMLDAQREQDEARAAYVAAMDELGDVEDKAVVWKMAAEDALELAHTFMWQRDMWQRARDWWRETSLANGNGAMEAAREANRLRVVAEQAIALAHELMTRSAPELRGVARRVFLAKLLRKGE